MNKKALSIALGMMLMAVGSAHVSPIDEIQAPRGERPDEIQAPRGERPDEIQAPRGIYTPA
jgi:hypothetical protein